MKIRIPSSYKMIVCILYIIGVVACCLIVNEDRKETTLLYFGVLTISLFLITLSDLSRNEKMSKILFWVGMLCLGSLMAFRAQTGIDDYNYKVMFQRANGISLFDFLALSETELGYKVLVWILSRLTLGNYDIAQMIITYIAFYFWGRAILNAKEHCSMPIFVMILWTHYYFIIMGAALVRIFLAIPIVLNAMQYLWNGDYKKYIVWIIGASMFHVSALIMLLFVFFILKEEWFYANWGIFIAVMSIVLPVAFILVAKIIVPILGSRYAGYGEIGVLSISIGSFDTLPVFLIGLSYNRYISEERRKQYIVSMILIALSIIFSICSSMVPLGRVVYYANLGVLLLISEILKMKPKRIFQLVIPVVLMGYCFFYLMRTGLLNESYYENLFPYSSFLGV